MAATAQQLANLAKARAARARNLKSRMSTPTKGTIFKRKRGFAISKAINKEHRRIRGMDKEAFIFYYGL
jgi:hypothetical protein